VVGLAFLALRLIEGVSALGAMDRLASELVKGLAEELWAEESTVDTRISRCALAPEQGRWFSGFGWRPTFQGSVSPGSSPAVPAASRRPLGRPVGA
jgi:hypothetical protein